MSKEQIEEMEKDLSEVQTIGLVITESQMDSRNSYSREIKNKTVARHLANKGYRKQSEVIDSFVARLKEAPIKCGIPLLGLSTKEEIEEYFNGIMLQVRDVIDNIANEMKGENK